MKVSPVRLVVLLGASLLLVVVLGLASGTTFTWRAPTGDMLALVDKFELRPGETVINDESTGARVCFLQCPDWTVTRYVMIDSDEDLSSVCDAVFIRAQSWLNSKPQELYGPGETSMKQACAAAIDGTNFGRDGWTAIVEVAEDSPHRYRLAVEVTQLD